jgi:hypothetical protein
MKIGSVNGERKYEADNAHPLLAGPRKTMGRTLGASSKTGVDFLCSKTFSELISLRMPQQRKKKKKKKKKRSKFIWKGQQHQQHQKHHQAAA